MQRALTAICVALTTFAGDAAISAPVQPSSVEEDVGPPAAANNVVVSVPSQLSRADGESRSEESDSDPGSIIVYEPDRSAEPPASLSADPKDPVEVDRAYLVETAIPGATMVRQGPELAIGRLHPEFARRLAGAIREAREAGLADAGIFSAYRPPAFGVGGFSDKFSSLHTYGLAVDMSGIGGPGSDDAKLWYAIAAKHGVVCPYGFANHVEWNHCQPTRMKIILAQNSLRETVTANGPINLESMFEAGNSNIESPQEMAYSLSSGVTEPEPLPHAGTSQNRLGEQTTVAEIGSGAGKKGSEKAARVARARREPPSLCKPLPRPNKETCGRAHPIETATRAHGAHLRQASTTTSRHHT